MGIGPLQEDNDTKYLGTVNFDGNMYNNVLEVMKGWITDNNNNWSAALNCRTGAVKIAEVLGLFDTDIPSPTAYYPWIWDIALLPLGRSLAKKS